MTVVDFRQFKEEKEPHDRGLARCLDCRHEWEAVAHHEAVWLQCPNCSLDKGRFIGHYVPDKPTWRCNCGNDLFTVTPDGCFCPSCGDYCKFPPP